MKRTLACLMALFLAVTTVLPSQASGMGTADSHTEASALSDSGTKKETESMPETPAEKPSEPLTENMDGTGAGTESGMLQRTAAAESM